MTKEDYIERHCHEFEGWVFEALINERHGGELSLWMKAYRARIRNYIGKMFDEKTNDNQVPKNAGVVQNGR